MKGKIFNAQEVQSIIAGNKKQFREIIKPRKKDDVTVAELAGEHDRARISNYVDNPFTYAIFYLAHTNGGHQPNIKCPYQVGQKIFIKERFARGFDSEWNPIVILEADGKQERKWRPAQQLKQEYSRITLLIRDIKVERLADISEEDCKKEGVSFNDDSVVYATKENENGVVFSDFRTPLKHGFIKLWNRAHKKPEEKFEANPWVFVYQFEVIK